MSDDVVKQINRLIDICREPVVGLDGKLFVPDHIYLTFKRDSMPKGAKTRLSKNRGPLGKICNVSQAGDGFSVVAIFNRKDVTAFLKAQLP